MEDVLPVLRSRADIDFALLQATLSGERLTTADLPHWRVNDHLVAALAVERDESVRYLTPHDLQQMGLSFDACFQQALQRLDANTPRPPQPAGNGLYAGLEDGCDASRALLPRFLRRAEVRGRTIVSAPDRRTLLIAGSDDEEGLENLIVQTAKTYRQGRSLDARLYCLDGDQLKPWRPPEGDRLYWKARQLEFLTECSIYTQQKDMLQRLYGESVFVASHLVRDDLRAAEAPPVFSLSSWSEGAVSLLPETDYLALVRLGGDGQPLEPVVVAWKDVMRLAGDHLRPLGMYPERYRVESFPDETQWGQLLEAALPPDNAWRRRLQKQEKSAPHGGKPASPSPVRASATTGALLGLLVAAVLLTVALGGLIHARPPVGFTLAAVALLLGALLATTAFASGLVRAFEERAVSGLLYLLAPLYWCYFLASRGGRTRGPLLIGCTALALLSAGGLALFEGSRLGARRGGVVRYFDPRPGARSRFRGFSGRSNRGNRRRPATPDPTASPRPSNGFAVPAVPEITFPELRNKDYRPLDVQLWQVAVDQPDSSLALDRVDFSLPLKGNERIVAARSSPFIAVVAPTFDKSHIRVFDVRNGEQIRSAQLPSRLSRAMALSPDGKWLVGVSDDHQNVEAYALDDLSRTVWDVGQRSTPMTVKFTTDGKLLDIERGPTAYGVYGRDLQRGGGQGQLWATSGRVQEHRWALSPAGRYLSFVQPEGDGQTVVVVDLRSKRLAAQLRFVGHDGFDAPPCRGLCFSPDGGEFAVLMADANSKPSRIVRIKVASGELLADHRIPLALDIFGLSPEAPGLQWSAELDAWFVSEQWLVDCGSGEVRGAPLGPVVGLSPHRRTLLDDRHVLHVKAAPGNGQVLKISRLEEEG